MLIVKSVSKIFKDGPREVTALSDVSLHVKRGDCAIVTGPSGCGKSTLLSLVGCLSRPTRGEIVIDGTPISRLPEHFICDLRRTRIGFVFQQLHLLRGYTAVENVGMPLVPAGIREGERRKRALPLLEMLGMADRADFPVHHLSGGEQQRVAIARALVNDPDLVIADEPFSSVDAENVAAIAHLLGDLNRRGKTLLVSTHIDARTAGLPVTASYALEKGALT